MSNAVGSRGTLRVVLYGVVLLGLLGASFAVGLQAGVERGALFTFVKDIKTRAESLFTARATEESSTPAATPEFARLYEPADIARAQAENQPPADYLNWSGFYRMTNRPQDLGGLRPTNEFLPAVISARLQPWARAKMEATDGQADDTGQICQPTGLFRATNVGGFLLVPGARKVLLVYSMLENAGVQRIYMDRTHPRNLRPTWNGDSIGYWEGGTLVVDTVGFNDKSWLQSTMEPHTEEARLIQRIRPVKDGAFIEIHYTVEDRKALTSAFTYTRYFKKEGESMPEVVCNDDLDIWRQFRNEALQRQLERAREIR